MRKGIYVTAMALGMSVMLSGCAYQVTGLKEDEQDQFAAYCAQIVSKYDDSASAGLTTVSQSKQVPAADTSKAASDGSTSADTDASDTKTADTEAEQQEVTKTFTEAIGIKGVSFLYRDAQTAGGYNSNDVYDLTPDKGNELLVVRLKDGKESVNADMTLLLNDLTTYQGTLKGKKSKNLIMLFQFPKGTIKDTSKVVYTVKKGDTTVRINTDLSKQR